MASIFGEANTIFLSEDVYELVESIPVVASELEGLDINNPACIPQVSAELRVYFQEWRLKVHP